MVKICVVVAAAVIVVSVVVIIVGVKIGSEIAEIYQLLLLFFCFTLVVVVDPKNLHSKFGPIGAVTAEIMLMLSSWWWVGGGGGGGVKSFLSQTQLHASGIMYCR